MMRHARHILHDDRDESMLSLGGTTERGGGKSKKKKLSDRRINNILTVLSKSLRYAADVELIHSVI
ncbi:MAG: hypothetical protein ACXVAN_07730 [Polyangia bacterium]